ncbi:hybrid sensor histidine kinase/response regulator [Methyloceanibacter superfactus]|uniref:histidine kinase n=1 Tax=Methyloceanibacter superfactus TaxID=1774969 RepID=A0A1E3W3B0_9HYPH|nr:PAS domain-containing protein [Methyloceanibacter superfactus]ODS00295.1 hybrid sensor histidine kinase/response regulator [Methyloceanibacter superfactus]
MTDINAPMRYAEPAADRTERDGSVGLVVLLALALAMAAVGLAMVSREMAEPFVLAILAGLAVVGVFCLFAGAVGILYFGQRHARNDLTKAFVDNLPQGALIADTTGRVLYANRSYRDLLGLDPEAAVPPPDRAFGGNPHLAEAIFRLARAAQQGRSLKEEFRLPPPGEVQEETGVSPRWFRIGVQPMPPDPRSGRKGSLVVWQVDEITQDRAREETNFAKVQAAIDYLDNAPAGFFTAGAEGDIAYVNATLAQWLGLDLSEVANRPLKLGQIMSHDSAALIAGAGRTEAQGTTRHFDIDLVKADGTNLPVRILHRLPRGSDLAHVLILTRGPGEAEEAGAAELRFARLFHAAPIAIATLDADGVVSATNAAFVRMFGADAEDGKASLESLVEPASHQALRRALEAASAGQGLIEPVDVTFAGPGERSGRIYLSPIEEAETEREAAIAYAVDTTEQRALEMQIAQSQKMQAVGQLAGGIAHDFNNMLTAIIGFSDFLLMNHRPTDPAFQDIMNIKQNANRAAGLVRQLLAFSRQQTLRPQVLQLGDVLSELSILLGRLLGENVELTLDQASDLWTVKADLHQFEQVIINLAVNARDAMPNGGKLAIRTANVSELQSRELGLSHVPPGEYVMIEVRDSGCGMSEEVKQKIFEPFFSTKEIGRGTGLGLSTVYGIVKQTGGYIFADSEEGAGTTMRVYLPRYHEHAAEVDQEPAKLDRKPEKPKDLTGRGTVLLVEDEDAVRSFAARALGQRGYQVLEASTGAEALEVFEGHDGEVDLVVSDVVMPEMDGPTLMKELRRDYPEIKIIFMSGYAEDAFRRNLDEKEDFMFLQKPFDLKQLAAAVKSALEA